MKRLVTFALLLSVVVSLGLTLGCDSNKTGTGLPPTGGGPAYIELRSTTSTIRGFNGDVKTAEVTAIARDAQGVAVSGAKIDFAIINPQPYKGAVSRPSAADTMTSDNGELKAIYTVSISRTTDVIVEARSGNVTNRITLSVIVVDDILGTLSIESESRRGVLAVPPGSSGSMMVTATLVDTGGRALQGMQVNFRTEPAGLGSIDSDTGTTDVNGRTSRRFTSIVGNYGICRVVASVGIKVASTNIEVRPVAAPANIDILADAAVVSAPEGVDMIINIEAIVTDSNRVGVPGTPVAFEAIPIGGGSTFGVIAARDTTDLDGRVTTQFRSLGNFGAQDIRARALPSADDAEGPFIEKSLRIEVKRQTIGIRSLSIRATPSFMQLPADSLGMANIRATVLDEFNRGVKDVRVDYSTDLGALANITTTDSTGVSRAVFVNNYQQGIATISASIAGTNLSASARIEVRQSQDLSGTLQLTTDRGSIFADNGLTFANLVAVLKDEDGQVLTGKPIIFTSRFGAVNSPVNTDTSGIARAVFTDIGVPSVDESGNPVPDVITARYDPLGLTAQVEITILPRNPVSSVSLRAGAAQMIAGRGDSTAVVATCLLANGAFAPAGTFVIFDVDEGRFSSAGVPVVGTSGQAETKYIAGTLVGTAHLTASVTNPPPDSNEVVSNIVEIQLIPGAPTQIRVTTDRPFLTTNDPSTFATISALVMDTLGNPVGAGKLLNFATDLGNIAGASSVTDSGGVATARLFSGVSAGPATVTATHILPGGAGVISGNVVVTFIAGSPNAIELTADPINIQVRGSGGRESARLTARIFDANGNPVETANTVVFELLREEAPPVGCNINGRGAVDSTVTAGGTANATLNSGTRIGGKLIRAYTWRDPATRRDTVQVTISNVAVVAGPPFQLDIDVNDDGDDAGGGAWVIEVSTRVWDINRNPVANSIPVILTVDPPIANVSPGFTGNNGRRGAPTQGLAYADLVYNSINTFDNITISAEVQGLNGVIMGERPHKLPLQDGQISLNIDPQNWMIDDEPNLIVRCWAILRDGHQILINNGPILFTSNRARFWWYDFQARNYREFFPDPARKLTGLVDNRNNEPQGTATVFLRGVMDDFFLDPFTLEVTVQINATVEGYNDVAADPAFLFVTRHG
ncbi:MAG: hypothetical protein FJY67_04760 [Calditrichaeota bacterium]|nr:hypothetical protein [Calditrichota bacterium]